MYARAVEDAASSLRELRYEEWGQLGLGALALGVSITTTQLHPPLALPLFLGGLVIGALGVRALWRRWDLVDRLSIERDAYVIPEVLAHAMRETVMDKRHTFAVLLRSRLAQPGPGFEVSFRAAAPDLERLACELENEELAFDPACAVACSRLLRDPAGPFGDPTVPPQDLRARVLRIRSGLTPRRGAG